MKKGLIIFTLATISCTKQQAYPPVGGVFSEKDLAISKNRAKNLNELERSQIKNWIDNQQVKYYPMGLNYWVDIENLRQRSKKADGIRVSYEYDLYDFDMIKLYEKPTLHKDVILGKTEGIKAIDDVVRYMNIGEEATLLVPSVLAFGTYGDNDKILNDTPLIIKLNVLN